MARCGFGIRFNFLTKLLISSLLKNIFNLALIVLPCFFDLVGKEASIVFPLIRRESKTRQSPGNRSIEAGSRKVHFYCLHLIQLLEPSTEWTNTKSLILWFLDSFPEGRTELNLSCDKCRGWREPGNKNLQRSRIFGLVLFMRVVTDQEGRPAWQRQLGAGAGRDSWSCSE